MASEEESMLHNSKPATIERLLDELELRVDYYEVVGRRVLENVGLTPFELRVDDIVRAPHYFDD